MVVPCTPLHPHTTVMMDALELYCVAQNHSPHFSIQAFVKTISDLQGVQFHPYLTCLFSIAIDVYLQMCLRVNNLILEALCQDTLDWHLKNACPACTYTLRDELDLKFKFKMLFAMDSNDSLKYISREAIGTHESIYVPDLQTDSNNPCAGRWKNMQEDVTSRMWGIFDEAGIFMAVCRHSFSLPIADIVHSSEQAKYTLAVVLKLLDVFVNNLAGSYDISCKFRTTLSHSTVAFHGYAHCHLCQLCFLARYIDGLGLEDLEGCEFHQCQVITGYIVHNDEYNIYQNLTMMIFNNYKQALQIIEEGKKSLPCIMDDLGITDPSVFSMWLLEESEYLVACSCEPEEETLHMDLEAGWYVSVWCMLHSSLSPRKHLKGDDVPSCHENFEKDLKIKLGIIKHWVPEDEEWQTASHLVANHKYQCCLNQLESLLLPEFLSYKLHKHITKALKAHSAAIHTTLNWFNTTTHTCSPSCCQLMFEDVVEYTLLADFDLLHNATHEDISQQPWASSTAHAAMDQYFKVCHVEEEIKHLNIEDCYMNACITQLQVSHPTLAYQVCLHYNMQARFTNHHLCLLAEITCLPGFTGTTLLGKSMKTNPDVVMLHIHIIEVHFSPLSVSMIS
ncbi:hypothetical protein EDC04DRAFT_2869913 [Pisolithus marmoratus]|nr:hypothetical protein EDC04DRAFT_2869913 [Pisolithus marmoratus]